MLNYPRVYRVQELMIAALGSSPGSCLSHLQGHADEPRLFPAKVLGHLLDDAWLWKITLFSGKTMGKSPFLVGQLWEDHHIDFEQNLVHNIW